MTEPVRITLPFSQVAPHDALPVAPHGAYEHPDGSVSVMITDDQTAVLGLPEGPLTLTVRPSDYDKLAEAAALFTALSHVYTRLAVSIAERNTTAVFRMRDLEAMGLDTEEVRRRLASMPKMSPEDVARLKLED
jgi:hypothetical protein